MTNTGPRTRNNLGRALRLIESRREEEHHAQPCRPTWRDRVHAGAWGALIGTLLGAALWMLAHVLGWHCGGQAARGASSPARREGWRAVDASPEASVVARTGCRGVHSERMEQHGWAAEAGMRCDGM